MGPKKLRQKCARRHDAGGRSGKAVGVDEVGLDHGLKRVAGTDLRLKVPEGRAQRGVRMLDLYQEPRLPVTDDDEVYLPLLLVAEVAQLEGAEP